MASEVCDRCGGALEEGYTIAIDPHGAYSAESAPRLNFVIPGPPVSSNLIKAFQQGLAGEPGDRTYRIAGYRCSQCGLLELYADPPQSA